MPNLEQVCNQEYGLCLGYFIYESDGFSFIIRINQKKLVQGLLDRA